VSASEGERKGDGYLRWARANAASSLPCPRWDDGKHLFRPGYTVRNPTPGQAFAETMTNTRYPPDAVAERFVALDRDDHRTDAKQCACGLVVKLNGK
jgi:hypothetical protein